MGENERHIGYQYYLNGNMIMALPHFNKSLKHRRSIGYLDGEIFALITLGRTHEKLKEYDTAIRFLSEALIKANRLESQIAQARIYSALGAIYLNRANHVKALDNLKKARTIAILINYKAVETSVSKLLAALEESESKK